MNKKVLTLCAGFVLAGGMLSSLSAVNLKEAANTGKYYKMVEGAFWNPGDSKWAPDNTGNWFLDLKETETGNVATMASNGLDYWKIQTVGDGLYELVNLQGDNLVIDGKSSFTLAELNDNNVANKQLSLLYVANTSTLYGYPKTKNEDGASYNLEVWDNTKFSFALDAVETNLQSVGGYDFNANDFFDWNELTKTFVADGKTYRIYYTLNGNNVQVSQIVKAHYNKQLKTWSFTDNETGADVSLGDEVDFELVKAGDDVVLKLPSGKGYVNCSGAGVFTIVDKLEDATVLAFEVTKERVPVTVGVLNYYEKDGFSVEITCAKDADGEFDDALKGDMFVGHLTPMTFNWTEIGGNNKEGKFEPASDGAREFYLKNADGQYIVAVPYNVEVEDPRESLYHFTTVTEDQLRHNLMRAWNGLLNDEQEYFGRFRASVDEAALAQDPTKLDEITWLEVNVASIGETVATFEYATVGRADISKVPTLVAACDGYVGTTLKDIHIKLGSGQVVDWKELLQPKFFTVEQYKADGTTLIGKLTASGYSYGYTNNWEWRKNNPGNELEGQFALTVVEKKEGNLTRLYYQFTNRETLQSVWAEIPVNALYYTDKDFTYKWNNNVYVIKPVAEVNEADGYVRFSDSELNRQYHIASSAAVYGQAYLTENHADEKDAQEHIIGLNVEKDNALVFNIKKYNAPRYLNNELNDENADHTFNYHPTDSIYVVSELGFYNTKTKDLDVKKDTLKVLSYSFVNQFNEPLIYTESEDAEGYAYCSDVYADDVKKVKYASAAKAHEVAQKFVVRMDNGKYNLRPVRLCKSVFNEKDYVSGSKTSADLYQVFDYEYDGTHNDFNKMYAGDATIGIMANTDLYNRTENDLFNIEETESEVYRRLANNVDTVSIYRNYNEKSLLYEKTTEIADDVFVNFLGMENIADFTKMAPAMIADTAYVRNETYKPQYMLIVDPTIHPAGKWCDVCNSDDCEHAVDVPAWTEGRILVNLVDSAKAWDEANKHQVGNPYKNTEGYYKLGFVQATHRNDSLIVNGKRQFIGNNDNHIAKFQFRYADTEDQSFVIETSLDGTQTPGYLKWMNGVVVVVDDIKNADIYNMNEDESRTPTANETIAAGNVVVAGTNGAVVVKGAEGKNVIVSTILGKVVANEVVSSDNAQIATPAGIVVVSVDGESFKVVVK